MLSSIDFFRSILNTLTEHIAVIDQQGQICFVNHRWVEFSKNNQCLTGISWDSVNYLSICDHAAKLGDDFGEKSSTGIRQVINHELDIFYLEYPCHSPNEKRWFTMRVTPFALSSENYFVIAHQDITERKLAEEQVIQISRLDGLTNIANRRYFDLFLNDEWQRCNRLKQPLSLVMVDLDHFKLLNDNYGHQYGDECLKKIANFLTGYCRRPSDLCARYGGEEFALIFGSTEQDHAIELTHGLIKAIEQLAIENKHSPISEHLTISAGLATLHPSNANKPEELIKLADDLLYQAKSNGRNQLKHQS